MTHKCFYIANDLTQFEDRGACMKYEKKIRLQTLIANLFKGFSTTLDKELTSGAVKKATDNFLRDQKAILNAVSSYKQTGEKAKARSVAAPKSVTV